MRKNRMIPLIVAAVILILLLVVFTYVDDWGRDWTTNHADMGPVDVAVSPDDLVAHIQAWTGRSTLWAFDSRSGDDSEVKLHLTRKTKILKFTDDIRLSIKPSEKGCSVTANSRSRIGKGDLGQNPRNLKELVEVIGSTVGTQDSGSRS